MALPCGERAPSTSDGWAAADCVSSTGEAADKSGGGCCCCCCCCSPGDLTWTASPPAVATGIAAPAKIADDAGAAADDRPSSAPAAVLLIRSESKSSITRSPCPGAAQAVAATTAGRRVSQNARWRRARVVRAGAGAGAGYLVRLPSCQPPPPPPSRRPPPPRPRRPPPRPRLSRAAAYPPGRRP